jgi:outer membrane protein
MKISWSRQFTFCSFHIILILFATWIGLKSFPVLAAPLSIEQAMELAEKNSFASRISQQSSIEASAKAKQSTGNLFPKLDLDFKRIWFDKSVNKGVGILPQTPERVTTAGLSIAQPIIGLAPLVLLKKVNDKLAENAVEDARIASNEARFLGAEAFVRATRAAEGIKIAKISIESVDKQQKDAKALLNAGRIGVADMLRFDLAHSDAKLALVQSESAFQLSKLVLGESIGIAPEQIEIEIAQTSLWEQNKLKIPEFNTAFAQASSERPDFASAENRLEAAKYYALATKLDYLPSLNAFANYERDFEAKSIDLIPGYLAPSALSPNVPRRRLEASDIRDKLSFGLQLKWTLWDWNTRWNKAQETSASEQKARIAQEAVVSALKIEVARGVQDLTLASASLDSAQSSVKLADEVLRLTQLKFQVSQASSADLILSERDRTRARANLSNARAEADLAWLRYQKVLGRKPTTVF